MSSTRYAAPGSPLSQNKFASSYDRGLLANLVAMRCEGLTPEQAAPIWFLQWLSWQPGGLHEVNDIAYAKLGRYNWRADGFEKFCLEPYHFFKSDGWEIADQFRLKWINDRPAVVQTSIGELIADALDYAVVNRCMVLVDGEARIGKSFASRECCERSAGVLRYCQVPSSNDDHTFFRALAKSLGVSSSSQLKAQQLRSRVEEVLQTGQIGIVFDEAHYLFDSFLRSTSLPRRVNWIMTALVNSRVPVVLITTPQFYAAQKRVEKSTGWTSQQFIGRIGRSVRLPDSLPLEDLIAVARSVFPEGNALSWRALADYSIVSKKYLAAIEALVNLARWNAKKAKRQEATPDDLRQAILESVLPTDIESASALAAMSPRKRHATTPPGHRAQSAALPRTTGEMISGPRNESVSLATD